MPVMLSHDTSIDYDVHGDGPDLVLIGGLGFGRWGWFKQIPALSRHFRTITFDVRGPLNLSRGVPDLSAEVVALLDYLGVEQAHVLGTSLGGFVAQELALNRPDVVDRLVLVCTSYGGLGPEPVSPQALAKMLGWGSFSAESAARQGLETATSDAYRSEHPEEFERLLHWRLADSPSTFDYCQQVMAGARFDASRNAGNIVAPTLVIHGADDQYVPLANAAALADAIPDARFRVLDDAGHLVFIERAEEVNQEIVSFLKPRRPWRKRIPQEASTLREIFASIKPRRSRDAQEPPAKREKKSLTERVRAIKGTLSFLEPEVPGLRERQGSQNPSEKQKAERPTRRSSDANEEVAREIRESSISKQLGERLRRLSQVPGDWAGKLRAWLSR